MDRGGEEVGPTNKKVRLNVGGCGFAAVLAVLWSVF